VTRLVALIGKPLKRRHSQVMHDAAFDACGIDARYVLMELEPDEIEAAVDAARGPGWLGLGVTATYKRVRHLFDFEGPQILVVKGKGELAAYRLLGRKTEAVNAASGI